jgi:cytoskeletal protein RodZ
VSQFGEKLRRERELRGITLEEVAVATKIGTRSLRALEEDKFSQLPGGIFNKGFVRAYARYVGIDEEQAVGDYMAANQDVASSGEVDIYVVARQFDASRNAGYGTRKHGVTALVWSLVAAVALVSASVAGWPYLKKWEAHRAEVRKQASQSAGVTALQASLPQPVQAASNSQAPPSQSASDSQAPPSLSANSSATQGTVVGSQSSTPSVVAGDPPKALAAPAQVNKPATAASAAAEAKKKAADSSFSLVLTAKERCWVSIQVDGKRVMEDTMDPESSDKRERSFQARDRLVVVAGNPAGIDVTFNGQSIGRIGPTNARRAVTFTAEGIQR